MYIEFDHVSKTYDVGTHSLLNAVRDISFTIGQGEFVSFVGPSGCGKSTLMKMIAGIESPDLGGSVKFQGEVVRGLSTERVYIFQDYALFPWLTVKQNIGFGLRGTRYSRKYQDSVVAQYIEKLGLMGMEDLYPEQLSGGMRQRTAIARALCLKPSLLLMDEPFSALDSIRREQMQNELMNIWETERTTILLVTHDVEEAIYLSDRIVVMSSSPGVIKKIVPVTFARPRVRTYPEYVQLREQVNRLLHQEPAYIK